VHISLGLAPQVSHSDQPLCARLAATQTTRQFNECVTVERAEALARGALGDAEFDRLVSEGRNMREPGIRAFALAEQDHSSQVTRGGEAWRDRADRFPNA